MRQKLKKFSKNRQYSFTASVVTVYAKHIMLGSVRTLDGKLLTDHAWVNVSRIVRAEHLKEGEKIRFSAHVHSYPRLNSGPMEDGYDFGLSQLRNIQRINGSAGGQLGTQITGILHGDVVK